MNNPTSAFMTALAAVLLTAGCASTPDARLYLLQADEQVVMAAVHHEHLADAKISILPVRIPDHLDRPQIITQGDRTELVYSEFHRWGESLANNLHQVLIRNLGARLPGSVVWNDRAMGEVKTDYKVSVQVQSATGILGETAELTARWNIFSGTEYELLATGLFAETTVPEGTTYNDYVQALSKLAADLSSQIARALQTIQQPQG